MARRPKTMTEKLLKKSISEIEKTLNSLRRTIESYMPTGKRGTKAKGRRRRATAKPVARKPARRTRARARR